MRTTVNIDDDILAVARALARRKRVSLGSALSELARNGIRRNSSEEGQFHGSEFDVPIDDGTFTSEDVYRSLSDWP